MQQAATTLPVIQDRQDWGEAPDVSRFYGRQGELQTLETWILGDGCRAIGIFGLGGMGKTALSVKLAQQLQSQFDYVIWRSLQQAPLLELILSEILPILVGSEVTNNSSIDTLMKQLRSKRCLLVLDNVNRSCKMEIAVDSTNQVMKRTTSYLIASAMNLTKVA